MSALVTAGARCARGGVGLALLAACPLAAGSSPGKEASRSRKPTDPPVLRSCSRADMEDWRRIREKPLGISARDNVHAALRPTATDNSCDGWVEFSRQQDGRADDGVHAWVLAAPCKHTACGRLESFESNLRTPWLSGEFDLNNNIRVLPEPWRGAGLRETRQILEDHACDRVVAQEAGSGAVSGSSHRALERAHLCFERPPGDAWTLHVEITPPARLRAPLLALWYQEGAWLAWKASLVDETLCVHGPFVADLAHEAKAEIHPTQLVWWKEALGGGAPEPVPGGDYGLFLIQDASSRYNKVHNFVIMEDLPPASQWRPWAQGPVQGQFDIPFQVKPGEKDVILRLESYFRELVPPNPPSLRIALWLNDDHLEAPPLAQAEWAFPVEAGLDISSQPPVCLCDEEWCESDRGSVFGTLRVDAQVGQNQEWGEGFLAMRLLDSRRAQPRLDAYLRWEPQRNLSGPAWPVVETGSELRTQMVDAVAVGLPPPPKAGSVRRLREAKVTAIATVRALALPETRDVRFKTRWTAVKLCAGKACNELSPKAAGENQIVLSLPGESAPLQYVVIAAEVQARGLPGGANPVKRIEAQHFWTHAFGAGKGEGEEWKQAWREWIQKACGDRVSRQALRDRAETALVDQILTLTELSEIYALCGEEGHGTTP